MGPKTNIDNNTLSLAGFAELDEEDSRRKIINLREA
jgi:hypothetical protein